MEEMVAVVEAEKTPQGTIRPPRYTVNLLNNPFVPAS
jgi:hypothetical protein